MPSPPKNTFYVSIIYHFIFDVSASFTASASLLTTCCLSRITSILFQLLDNFVSWDSVGIAFVDYWGFIGIAFVTKLIT